jgi:hypothetical protein
MSVDVDSWSSLLRFYSIEHDAIKADLDVEVSYGITKLLDLFKEHDLKATFFVPGEVGKNNRETIKQIAKDGHEIACHGYKHDKNECLLSLEEQTARIKEATEILRVETGCTPKGFRAPCLRANGVTAHVLQNLGYVYDSSVIPSSVPGYYGHLTASSKPYRPSLSSLEREGKSRIIELPVSVNPILRIPLSAAWMRNLGVNWVKIGVKTNFCLGIPVMFYIHPRDVSSLPSVKGLPWHLYRNTGQKAIEMLNKIAGYVKRHGEAITGIELAERYSDLLDA